MFWFILLLIGCGWYLISNYFKEQTLNAQKSADEETNNRILLARSVLPQLKEYRLNLKADINEIRKLLNSADRDSYKIYLSNKEELEEREKLISVLIDRVGELAHHKILSEGINNRELWNSMAGTAYYKIYNETTFHLEDIQKLLNN